jgi:putative sugar O-methyltransferase
MENGSTHSPITDDHELLRLMVSDAKAQRDVYRPGPYWSRKTKNAVNQIGRHGLADFRGASSSIGLSFTDSIHVDVRHDLASGFRRSLKFLFETVFPFKDVFAAQVALTTSHAAEARRLKSLLLAADDRVRELLMRYKLPCSLSGGCVDYLELDGRKTSAHYLNLLHQHAQLTKHYDFTSATSMFEIGGGFGVNVHLLLENYPKLKKVVYLDIPPNLYIGTQYLKSFYGKAVVDYRDSRELQSLVFSPDGTREILAIAPWQIEKLALNIDLIYNAHSFVEMPQFVVSNYADKLARLSQFESATVLMLTYDCFDLRTTFDPELLPSFFPTKTFHRFTFPVLDRSYNVISFVGRQKRAGGQQVA